MTELRFEFVIGCPRQVAYAAWVSEYAVFAPTKSLSIEPHVGGQYRLLMDNLATMTGHFRDVVHEQRLIYTWQWAGSDNVSEVKVLFADVPEGTQVTLVHSGLATTEDEANHRQGWHSYIDNFVQYLTGVDYGPLLGLVGRWRGEVGVDVSPAQPSTGSDEIGVEQSPYDEVMVFEPVGDVDNAETQDLTMLRYRHIVRRKSNGEVFHNESGYYAWDGASQQVVLSFAIPRGVGVVATGDYAGDGVLEVVSDPELGIAETRFMRDHARTSGFTRRIEMHEDRLVFSQTTELDIYGGSFEHSDTSVLVRDY